MQELSNKSQPPGNQNSKPQSALQRVAKFVMKSVLWIIGIALLLALLLWLWIGDKMTDGVFTFYERTFWMTKSKANIISFILVIGFSGTLTWMALCALAGRNKVLTASVAVAIIAGLIGFDYHTRKEIFAPGKDAQYICSPSSKGGKFRLQKTPTSYETDKPCPKVDSEISAIVQDIIDDKFVKPTRLPLKAVLSESFELSENGLTIVYKSAIPENDLPILFSGPGWDPLVPSITTANFLKPVTPDDVKKIKTYLAEQEAQKTASEKKAADDKKAADVKEADAKASAEKAAKLKAEKEEVEYKKGVYKNVTELVADLKQEKQKLEEEERLNGSARTTQKSKAPRRGDNNILTVHRGMYVVSMTNLVNVYVDEKKASIPFTSEAFEELHSQGKKIQVATEGCWFCEEWVTLGTIVKNNKKRIDEIDQALRMYARELENLRREIPELTKASHPQKSSVAQISPPTAGGEVVMSFVFVNRDPPKPSFEFSAGTSGSIPIKQDSDGIYIQGRGKACGKIEIIIDNGLERFDICDSKLGKLLISGGRTYEVINSTGAAVYTANHRK